MKTNHLFLVFFLIFGFTFSPAQSLEVCYETLPGPTDQDTVNIYFRSNTDTTISIRAVQFSFAFRSMCSNIQIIDNPIQSRWGVFLEASEVDSSANQTYNGILYDYRFSYGNADPGAPSPSPFVAPINKDTGVYVLKLLRTGSCRGEVYMENESENQVNQMGNQDFFRVEYVIGFCGQFLALEDEIENKSITLYPNPAKKELFIVKGNSNLRWVDVSIHNTLGQVVHQQRHPFSSPVSIDVSQYPAGIYVVALKGKKGQSLGGKRFRKN